MFDNKVILSYPISLSTTSTISVSTLNLMSLSIRHLHINTSSQDINLALQELGCDVISVTQMTTKCPSPDGSITTITLPRFYRPWRALISHNSSPLPSSVSFIWRSKRTKPRPASYSATTTSGSATSASTASSPRDVSGSRSGHRHQKRPENDKCTSLSKCCNYESQPLPRVQLHQDGA
jgi:hypothetical protein